MRSKRVLPMFSWLLLRKCKRLVWFDDVVSMGSGRQGACEKLVGFGVLSLVG